MNDETVKALIYKPMKTAMQSGYVLKNYWILEFLDISKTYLDPLMGWSGSKDTKKQIKLKFFSKEDAIKFANDKKINFRLKSEIKRKIKPKSYAENFSFNKKVPWTH